MEVDVFDTYATRSDGGMVHFDMVVPSGTDPSAAYEYAIQWLNSVGLSSAELKQSRCNFCHTVSASEKVASDIEADGFHIIRMEGCPAS